jgi:hypothetical protein
MALVSIDNKFIFICGIIWIPMFPSNTNDFMLTIDYLIFFGQNVWSQ